MLNDAIKDEPVDVEVVDETLPEIKVEVEDPQPIPAPPVVENTQQGNFCLQRKETSAFKNVLFFQPRGRSLIFKTVGIMIELCLFSTF